MNHSTHIHNSDFEAVSNPCIDDLSDGEYIEHMIPHHQVAVDMSELLIPKLNDPIILNLCRNIIKKQKYEMWEMTHMKRQINDKVFSNNKGQIDDADTVLDKYYPILSKSKDGNCNPLFFKPNDHMAHMAHMEVTSKSYLEHMIPHHQVAIDMSRRLLLHTNNSYLLDFCRKLIIEQQYEIYYMNNLLNGLKNKTWVQDSDLLK
jgi:uncharacterized protein (DUF305 family)